MNCDPRAGGVNAPVAVVHDDGAVKRGTLSSTSVDVVPSVRMDDLIMLLLLLLLLLLKEEVLAAAEPRPRCRFLEFRRYRACGEMKRSI